MSMIIMLIVIVFMWRIFRLSYYEDVLPTWRRYKSTTIYKTTEFLRNIATACIINFRSAMLSVNRSHRSNAGDVIGQMMLLWAFLVIILHIQCRAVSGNHDNRQDQPISDTQVNYMTSRQGISPPFFFFCRILKFRWLLFSSKILR